MSQRGLLLNCLKIENLLGKKTPLEQKFYNLSKELFLVHFHFNLLILLPSYQ
jgi:hypothetical protein